MRQILVTGGAGFVGSHLTEALLAQGNRVTVLDDESTGSLANLSAVRGHFDFHYVRGDVADSELLCKLLADIDEVYHLAAPVGVKRIVMAPIESIEKTITPLQCLLAQILGCSSDRRAIKLFVASSSEVYGKNPNRTWSETDDLVFGPTSRMRWSYGASKAIDEFLALAYYRQHNLPVVIGRLFNATGARQSPQSGMVLPRLVDLALRSEPLTVHDDGQQVRCFAHVEDVCRAMIDLMDTPAAIGQVVNIGSDQPITIFELAERIVSVVNPTLDIEFESYRQVYGDDFENVRRRVPDLSRLRQLIGWQAHHNLDGMIREVVDWNRHLQRQADHSQQ